MKTIHSNLRLGGPALPLESISGSLFEDLRIWDDAEVEISLNYNYEWQCA